MVKKERVKKEGGFGYEYSDVLAGTISKGYKPRLSKTIKTKNPITIIKRGKKKK